MNSFHNFINKVFTRQGIVYVASTLFCCVSAYFLAFMLRFDFGFIPPQHRGAMWLGVLVLLPIRLVGLYQFKTHRGLFQFVSIHDLGQILKATALGSLLFAAFWLLAFNPLYHMPRSIFLLDWILCVGFLVGIRVLVRVWRRRTNQQAMRGKGPEAEKALIVGAGQLGASVLTMVDQRFMGQQYEVVGFVDDDINKHAKEVHGVPVLGTLDRVKDVVQDYHVKTVLFAMLNPPQGLLEKVIASCDGLHVKFTVAAVSRDMDSGELNPNQIREVKIEDLLGRNPVEVERTPVQAAVAGRTVLVSGAGGSIGSELCRQIASYKPSKLVLFEAGESPLFEIDRELRQTYPELDIVPFIGDIKHENVIERAFASHKPDFVYHAAAYKHVPLMEAHPDEAVLNNVRGTRLLAEAARRHGCERFVMISTDKAVRPTNVMGATKRMCELTIQSLNGAGTIFAAVRFGNVLGSNGSVIPTFKKQIESGGPVTITHPDMTRYFMTIPEAVALVLQCGVIAEPGDTFVLDMGTPMKIIDLARNMIRLSGLTENVDIQIKEVGLRPGEKMFEELVAYGEALTATHVPKVNVLKKSGELACGSEFVALKRRMEELAEDRNVEEVRRVLWLLMDIDSRTSQGERDCSRGCCAKESDPDRDSALPADSDQVPVKGKVLGIAYEHEGRGALRSSLSAAGLDYEFVDSIEMALQYFMSGSSYVAICCNYYFKMGTIWKLQEKLLELRVEIPVIATTACDSEQRLDQLRQMGARVNQLQKPFQKEHVSRIMQER